MVNVFFDMDGVLAKWNDKATVEDTFKEGYFRNVKADPDAVNALKNLICGFEKANVSFYILSARYDDAGEVNRFEQDKLAWLEEQGINIPVCFVACGEPKANALSRYQIKGSTNILFDDHTPNLNEWEMNPNNLGVKWLNDVNGSGKSGRRGLCVEANRMDEFALTFSLAALIERFLKVAA